MATLFLLPFFNSFSLGFRIYRHCHWL